MYFNENLTKVQIRER